MAVAPEELGRARLRGAHALSERHGSPAFAHSALVWARECPTAATGRVSPAVCSGDGGHPVAVPETCPSGPTAAHRKQKLLLRWLCVDTNCLRSRLVQPFSKGRCRVT